MKTWNFNQTFSINVSKSADVVYLFYILQACEVFNKKKYGKKYYVIPTSNFFILNRSFQN